VRRGAYSPTSHFVVRAYPPLIYPRNFHLSSFGLFPLCLPPFPFDCVSNRVFTSPPSSHVCFCQRDTCCCILLCRIAEFSRLLNLLTTFYHFVSTRFHHIFTLTLHSHSFHSFTFVSFLLGLCFHLHATRARLHSTSRTTRVSHRSTVSAYPGTFTLPTNRQQLYPFPYPRFLPFSESLPFYRRGPRVTCWITLPRFLSHFHFPLTYDLLLPSASTPFPVPCLLSPVLV